MSNAEKLNLDQLPWFFDDVMVWAVSGGLQLALLIWLILIGAGELSRVIEFVFFDVPFFRPRFWGYFYGDWFLAGLGFMAYRQINEHFQGSDRFYVQPWWYALMLLLGTIISVGMEVWAVLDNRKNPEKGYTWQQELTPSKLAHTVGLALAFGLLTSLAIPVLVAGSIADGVVAGVAIAALVSAWIGFNVLDNKFRNMTYLLVEAHPHPSRYAQADWPWRRSRGSI